MSASIKEMNCSKEHFGDVCFDFVNMLTVPQNVPELIQVSFNTFILLNIKSSVFEHLHCVFKSTVKLLYARRENLIALVSVSSGNLDKQTERGNTALHYCCLYEKHECLKLLLRGKPATDISELQMHVVFY